MTVLSNSTNSGHLVFLFLTLVKMSLYLPIKLDVGLWADSNVLLSHVK